MKSVLVILNLILAVIVTYFEIAISFIKEGAADNRVVGWLMLALPFALAGVVIWNW